MLSAFAVHYPEWPKRLCAPAPIDGYATWWWRDRAPRTLSGPRCSRRRSPGQRR
jgi:hypothetical protein